MSVHLVRNMCVVATLILFLITGFEYGRRAYIGAFKPVTITWLIMFGMMLLSVAMYLSNPDKSWDRNMGLIAGAANSVMIMFGVITGEIRQTGRLSLRPTRLQWWCIAAYVILAALWLLTSKPLLAYTFVQLIPLAAYTPTAYKLWHDRGNTEPLAVWFISLAAICFAIVPAIVDGNWFARVYVMRTLVTTLGLIILILRARRRRPI